MQNSEGQQNSAEFRGSGNADRSANVPDYGADSSETLGIPGVTVASAIAIRPPLSGTINMPVRIDGKSGPEQQRAQFLPILSDYFKTLQVPVIQGREFTTQDRMGTPPVAIINRAMARFFWPNESAIGKRIQIDAPLLPNQPMRETWESSKRSCSTRDRNLDLSFISRMFR